MSVVESIGRSAQSGEGSVIRRTYHALGYATELLAIAAVAGTAPATIGGNVVRSIEPFETSSPENWDVVVTWGVFQAREAFATGESQFNFEVSVQPTKVFVGVAANEVYGIPPRPVPADSASWLIGDQGDGERPDGVEVFDPATAFSETHYVAASSVDATYKNTLMRLVGKTNNASFKGWSAGEVLAQSVSGSKRGSDDWEISFRFLARENQTGLTIAGISGINKLGWQYLWPRYRLVRHPDAPVLSNLVEYIVVSTVFRSDDFTAFGIGT